MILLIVMVVRTRLPGVVNTTRQFFFLGSMLALINEL